jgi:hypothetical protein
MGQVSNCTIIQLKSQWICLCVICCLSPSLYYSSLHGELPTIAAVDVIVAPLPTVGSAVTPNVGIILNEVAKVGESACIPIN